MIKLNKKRRQSSRIIEFFCNNKIPCILLLITFGCLIFCHYNTFLGNDDLPYSFFLRKSVRVTNLYQVLYDNVRYYLTWCGRFIIHCIVMTLLIFGKNVWAFFNPFMIVLIIFFFYYKICKRSNLSNSQKILTMSLLIVLFLSLYEFKSLLYWVAGSVNYLWVLTFLILYCYLYYEKDVTKKKILNFILLFLISSLHENSFVFLLIFFLATNVIEFIKTKKLKNIFSLIPIILGGLTVLLAPGNIARNTWYPKWNNLSIFKKLSISIPSVSKSVFQIFKITNIISTVYIIVISFKLISLIKNKCLKWIILCFSIVMLAVIYYLNNGWVYFGLAIILFLAEFYIHLKDDDGLIPIQFGFYAIAFSMIITPLYDSGRPNLLLFMYFSFIITLYIVIGMKNKKISFVSSLLSLLLLLLLLTNEIVIFRTIGSYHKKRLEEIKAYNKTNVKGTLVLSEIPKKYEKYHVDCNDVNEDFWTYEWFVKYYHIKEGTRIIYKK